MGTSTLFLPMEDHSSFGVGAEVPSALGARYPEEGTEVYPHAKGSTQGVYRETETLGSYEMDEKIMELYEQSEEDDVHDPTTMWSRGYSDHEYGEPLPDALKEWLGDRSPVFELNGSL